jgi:chromate transporter
VLRAFAWLGLTSFGGPVAHIGYFRREFVDRRRWLGEQAYADLVALCQFLPGPASSKLGFSLGILRAGHAGGLAAWVGFTLPSAALLVAFASGAAALPATPVGAGLLHGLKLVAVAIVAQAAWGMARSLCPDPQRAAIGVAAAALVLLVPTGIGQVGAILLGAMAGLAACRGDVASLSQPLPLGVSRGVGLAALGLFTALLLVCSIPAGDGAWALFAAFYRSGALVFGGGHVVLPMLDEAVVKPGWVDAGTFLAGYGAAQAVPGPLFTFAAYLGAVWPAPLGGLAGASLALVAIFLPGLLLQLAALPFWDAIRSRRGMQAAMRGINAAVVGILGAALYDPVWKSAVLGPADVAIALAAFVLLVRWHVPPLVAVLLCAAAGVVTTLA